MMLVEAAVVAAIAATDPEPLPVQAPQPMIVSEEKIRVRRERRVHRMRARVVKIARSRIGFPYIYGAAGPRAFDCSGLTQWTYRRAGKYLPRTTWSQRYVGREVGIRSLRRGDLVFSYGDSHVEIYAGHGLVVVAPRSGTTVTTQSLWSLPFSGARRLIRKKP